MTANVRRANKAGWKELAPELPVPVLHSENEAYLHLVGPGDLGRQARAVIYDLYHANMSDISAESSLLLSRTSKERELFHPDSRFLIISEGSAPIAQDDTPAMPGSLPPKSKGKVKAAFELKPGELVGFCSFRFDTEDTLEGDDVEVIYCYELQLAPKARGRGLGALLIEWLEDIGRNQGMEKSMLTCLKKNTDALAFYTALRYRPDEIDPTRTAEAEEWQEVDAQGEVNPSEEVDYVILSKRLIPP